MDNFMDKLSNRFHAGEIIRANAEADAKQIQGLKEQAAQQAEVLSEVRRLNLKTIEVSEQISQMAALTIEKLEAYEAESARAEAQSAGAKQAPVAPDGTPLTAENAIDQGTGWEVEMYQGMSQLHTELQNIESLESSLLAFQESQTEQNTRLAGLMQQSLEAQLRPNSWQTEVWQSMSLMQQQLQNVEQLAGSQAALQEQLQAAQHEMSENLRGGQEELARSQLSLIQSLREKLDVLLSDREKDKEPQPQPKPQYAYEIEASLSEIEHNAETGRAEMKERMETLSQTLSQALSKEEKPDLSREISSAVSASSDQTKELLAQIKELLVGLRVYLDEVEKKAEDFVHKEDVKVYRNVQAVVMETVSARNRDVLSRIDAQEKQFDKLKGIKPLLVMTFLFSLASLAAVVVQMLGLFG